MLHSLDNTLISYVERSLVKNKFARLSYSLKPTSINKDQNGSYPEDNCLWRFTVFQYIFKKRFQRSHPRGFTEAISQRITMKNGFI